MSEIEFFIERGIRLKVKAPDWPKGLDWFNAAQPLSLSSLRGKVVLLDFWTFCCINCMHILPDLKRLEQAFPNELVVIGIHSAKFNHEQVSKNIRQSILKYEVLHPVVNDHNMEIWRSYTVRGWPTLVLIDPEGNVVLQTPGEGHYDLLHDAIQELIRIYKPLGKLDTKPLHRKLEAEEEKPTFLQFPGKVRVRDGNLLISDTNHNRILLADLLGHVKETIEGPLHHPRGVEMDGDHIYIADTGNHAIRLYDRKTREFKTLGEKLNSPWDLVKVSDLIFIAMAGSHQIWVLELRSGELHPFAGSGAEALVDGTLGNAALAQPSGIAADGHSTLYVADSEVSAVRKIDLFKREVKTVIGQGLFEFGDRDGAWEEALLQHPLGVDFYEGKVFLADSYNHKIKELDLVNREIKTLFGGEGIFFEPGGLSVYQGKIYVADTNHHAIQVCDLKTQEITTLSLS